MKVQVIVTHRANGDIALVVLMLQIEIANLTHIQKSDRTEDDVWWNPFDSLGDSFH